jgi:hypothetical protein
MADSSRAEKALAGWKSAIQEWTAGSESDPRMCHPWSEIDFQRRLKSFGEASSSPPLNINSLAAAGFEKAGDMVLCQLCHAQRLFADHEFVEHNAHCPWRGRPFAAPRLTFEQRSEEADVFESTRHALGAITKVSEVMHTITSSHS